RIGSRSARAPAEASANRHAASARMRHGARWMSFAAKACALQRATNDDRCQAKTTSRKKTHEHALSRTGRRRSLCFARPWRTRMLSTPRRAARFVFCVCLLKAVAGATTALAQVDPASPVSTPPTLQAIATLPNATGPLLQASPQQTDASAVHDGAFSWGL